MSLKCALAGLDAGGGKTTLIDHPGLDQASAYRAVGAAVEELGGTYVCGPDVGTGDRQLAWVRERTNWVNPEGNDANAATARGVLAGIRGLQPSLEAALNDLSFIVQGLGGVGGRVARELVAAGARVQGCDVNPGACDVARTSGIDLIDPSQALTTPCDVLVPCALGGILDAQAARSLPVRAVCGSANNQLRDSEAAQVLADRGVVWVPDFLASAGAVIEGVVTTGTPPGPQRDIARGDAQRLIDQIEHTTRAVLAKAEQDHATPLQAALALARDRLDTARQPRI